jgi:hypothetical protein
MLGEDKMARRTVLLFFVFLTLIASIISVSANFEVPSCDPSATTVKGTIYQNSNLGDQVPGAFVEVTCHTGSGDVSKNTTSGPNGGYSVLFKESDTPFCNYGDNVTVTASYAGLDGTNEGKVSKNFQVGCLTLNVGIINVPLIPEYGLIAGMATVLGAIAVFFYVRRR